MAGTLVNQVLGIIQETIKGHPFTMDIANTVSTVADQAYVDLVAVTDILEIINVYERTTNRRLPQITYQQYIDLVPDPTRFEGIADLAWAPTQVLTSGVPNWFIYFVPTPSSAQTIYYDYMKTFSLSAAGDYCPLPVQFDNWIYTEFKPLWYEIVDSKNRALIDNAYKVAMEQRAFYRQAIMSQATRYDQVSSRRGDFDYRRNLVATTVAP